MPQCLRKQYLRLRALLAYHMVLSLIEILAHFPKFQKAMRHTRKSLAAHSLRTTTTNITTIKTNGQNKVNLFQEGNMFNKYPKLIHKVSIFHHYTSNWACSKVL